MYKKISTFFTGLFLLVTGVFAQNSFLGIGAIYSNHSRKGLDNYMNYAMKELDLPQSSFPDTYGISVGYSVKNNSSEFIFGGSYSVGKNVVESSDKSRIVSFKQNVFNLNLGVDKYLVPWYFIGGQFLVSSFTGTFKYDNSGTPLPADSNIDFTEDSFNFLKGYSVGLRGETGFFVPVGDNGSGLRLSGYYDLGLSKYNYYESFDKVLTTYTGDKKTKENTWGIVLQYQFGLGSN
jgi:hypothetical protein